MTPRFLFTCEHAEPALPEGWATPDWLTTDLLHSHRGWDKGAAELTRALAENLHGESFAFPVTRLLIDANRKPQTALQSKARQTLTPGQCSELELRYQTYRNAVKARAVQMLEEVRSRPGTVLRVVSLHSFTPVLKVKKRRTDIGLLFRTDRPHEADFARHLKSSLVAHAAETSLARATQALTAQPGRFGVHFNLPYRGFTDCFLNDVLDGFGDSCELTGLMIEVNQNLLGNKNSARAVAHWLATALRQASERINNRKAPVTHP